MRAITKFHETEEAAIQAAKGRTKQTYRSQYVYHAEQGFYVSAKSWLIDSPPPFIKVCYDGEISDLRKGQQQV